MRHLAHVALAIVLIPAMGWALDTRHCPPAKPPSLAAPNVPRPTRQGGDTIDDAIAIPAIPFTTNGTTTGFNDDYDEVCPYDDSTAPDVVYRFVPADDVIVDIDMLGSNYDTKIYLYDAELELVACNDDFYPDYVSRLRFVELHGGAQYDLVIDGYGEEHGDYVLTIERDELCELDIPVGAVFEGEPPLVDGYLDAHNGGCNSPSFGTPWQNLYGDENGELVFHGVSGWYVADGIPHCDTDWFFLYLGEADGLRTAGDRGGRRIRRHGALHGADAPDGRHRVHELDHHQDPLPLTRTENEGPPGAPHRNLSV